MTAPESPVEGTTWLRVGRSYRAPLLVRRFPPELPFGFLGRLVRPTDAVEFAVEAIRLPPSRALELLHGARTVAAAELSHDGGGSAAAELEVERASAEELGRAIARRSQELWRVGLRWTAFGGSRARAEAERQRLAERLAALGFESRVPRYEVREALRPLGHRPADPRPDGYWQTVSSDGLAALFPFVDEAIWEPGGTLVGLSLADGSPVVLDRWSHASHSWAVFGTTGAGKTFAAALAILRGRWMRPDLDVVVLDPLGEFGPLVEALGGTVVPIADPSAGRLNPLDPVTTGGDLREKAARSGAMLRALFPTLTDDEGAALDAALGRLYDGAPTPPTFEELATEVGRSGPVGRLGTLLDVFRTGSLRAVNGPTTLGPLGSPVAVDLAGVPTDQLPFHLAYLLDWAYGRMRGKPGPKLLVVDEAHLLARHPATLDFLDRVVRHVRHFSAGLLLLTQGPDDFLTHPTGRSLLRNLSATAFLRLPEVSADCRAFFGLTPAEAEWLPKARLPRDAGYSESLWRIGEWHLPLAVVASTPEFEFLERTLRRPPEGAAAASPREG